MKIHSGFTLLELLVTFVILGIISLLAINGTIQQIPDFKVKEDVETVEQALKIARSTAIKKSCIIEADFSKASGNNGENGGIIEVKDQNGNIYESFVLNHNVYLNPSATTLENNVVDFDYRGTPIDNSGSAEGFDSSNNTVSISYYDGYNIKVSKNLKILPMTGNISH